MDRKSEVELKLARVRALMAQEKAGGVWVNTLAAFYWLTAGGEGRVGMDVRNAASWLLVTEKKACVVSNNIESVRLLDEELGDLGFEFVIVPWHEPDSFAARQAELAQGLECLSDTPLPGARLAPGAIKKLRYSLLPPEGDRLRQIGRDAAQAIQLAAQRVQPGMHELHICGLMAEELMSRQLVPTVLLMGVDERVLRYRHPVPTATPLKRYAMLVCCCRRGGLTVSLSRAVHFGPAPQELLARQQVAAQVDAAMISLTLPGVAVKDILAAGMQAYEQAGFPEEWRHHHQGGAIGYEPREYLASPSSGEVVQEHQAFTWNPTVQGTKSEDTILARPGQAPELLTFLGDWPALEVETTAGKLTRPGILEK